MPMDEARAEVLARVRAATASAGSSPSNDIVRAYRRGTEASRGDTLQLLRERLRDYEADVEDAPAANAAAAIARILRARGAMPVLVPAGFRQDWLPAGSNLVVDADFSPRELDAFGGVLTTATLAIAETGTLVLQHGDGQGRRAATLVPDFHLCVVRSDDVVATVPEAFLRLAPRLPTTFISGPSATADIEMTRIKGVHGPRFLHVLLLT